MNSSTSGVGINVGVPANEIISQLLPVAGVTIALVGFRFWFHCFNSRLRHHHNLGR
jgi:hypothetical protein